MKFNQYMQKKNSAKINESAVNEASDDSLIDKIKGIIAYAKCQSMLDKYEELVVPADEVYVEYTMSLKVAKLIKKKAELNDAVEELKGDDSDAATAKRQELKKISEELNEIEKGLDERIAIAQQKGADAVEMWDFDYDDEVDNVIQDNLSTVLAKRKKVIEQGAVLAGLDAQLKYAASTDDKEMLKKIQDKRKQASDAKTQAENSLNDAEDSAGDEVAEAEKLQSDLSQVSSYKEVEQTKEALQKISQETISKWSKILKMTIKEEPGSGGADGGEASVTDSNPKKGGDSNPKKGGDGITEAVNTIKQTVSAIKRYKPEAKESNNFSELLGHINEDEEQAQKAIQVAIVDLEKLQKGWEDHNKSEINFQKEVAGMKDASNTMKAAAGVEFTTKDGKKVESKEIPTQPPAVIIDTLTDFKKESGSPEKKGKEATSQKEAISNKNIMKFADFLANRPQ